MPKVPPTIAELNRRIVIQTQTTTQDPVSNQPVDQWNDSSPLWARISDDFQSQSYTQTELVDKAMFLITWRWSRSLVVAAQNRIKWTDPATQSDHIYQIESLFPFDPLRPYTFTCALVYELDGTS